MEQYLFVGAILALSYYFRYKFISYISSIHSLWWALRANYGFLPNSSHEENTANTINKEYCITEISLWDTDGKHYIIDNTHYEGDLVENEIHIDFEKLASLKKITNVVRVEINYSYDGKHFVLPVEYDMQKIIFPVYTKQQIEKEKFKIEIERAKLVDSEENNSLEITDLIRKYAGPTGNFYNGTKFQIRPEMILDSQKSPLVGPNKEILFTTNMGEDLRINHRKQILEDSILY